MAKMKRIRSMLMRGFKDILGIVVIGSYAEGSATKTSDIDVVVVKLRKSSIKKIQDLEAKSGEGVQIIPFTRRELKYHLQNATTMAHSIKNGRIVYDKTGILHRLQCQELGLPDREWMRKWFNHWLRFYRYGIMDRRRNRSLHKRYCRRRCHCEVGDYFARATVNFAILYLETKGVVPTTKRKIRSNCRRFLPQDLMRGMEIAFTIYHEKRNLRAREAEYVFKTASWLRNRLKRILLS